MLGKIATFCKKIVDYTKSEYCLLKYFRDAFEITNRNIILATPLMLFTMFSVLYLVINPANNISSVFIVLSLLFAIVAVFLSGWFYTIKLAITNFDSNKEKEIKTFDIIKQFPSGVGINFVKILLMTLLFAIGYTLVILLTYKLAYNATGDIGLTNADLILAQSSNEAMKKLLTSLSTEQLSKLVVWYMSLFGTTMLYSFVLIYWIPEIVCNLTGTFKALWIGLKNLFRSFFKILTIFCFLLLIDFVISSASALYNNQIVGFITTVLFYYFLLYAGILVMLFYKREFGEDNEQ